MSIYQKLAVATATATLSLAAMEAKIQAATIIYDFTVDVTSGPLSGTQSFGSFSYDDLALTGTGLETLGVNEGLSISFDFLGETYNETDDIGSLNNYPIVQFQDQSLLGLNFNVFYSPSFQSFAIADEVDVSMGAVGLGGGNVFAYDTDPSVEFEGLGTVTYQQVPEASSVVGLGVLGLGFLLKKKVTSSRKRKATVDIVR